MSDFGFQNTTLDVTTRNGLDDVLLEPLEFVRKSGQLVRAQKGTVTDGVSTPRFIWWLLPPVGSQDYFCGVLHDSFYKDTGQRFDGVWVKETLNRRQCDDLMLEAMTAQGVGWFTRYTIYWALRLFGGAAFKKDRAIFSKDRDL